MALALATAGAAMASMGESALAQGMVMQAASETNTQESIAKVQEETTVNTNAQIVQAAAEASLEQPMDELKIRVRCGEACVGVGELVEFDGNLGVRLSQLS